MKNSKLLMLQMKNDNWEAVDEMDNWLYVFDRMPPRMRLTVDLKIQGNTNKQIAKILSCSVNCVCNQLTKAKKRFLRAENII